MQKPVSFYFSDYIFMDAGHKYKNLAHPKVKFKSSTGVKSDMISGFRSRYWIAWTVVKQLYVNRKCDYGNQAEFDHFRINGNQIHHERIWESFPDECAQVKQEWKAKSDEGQARGSCVHDFLENIVGRKVYPTPRKYGVSIRNAMDYWKEEKNKEDIVFRECEVVMGDLDSKIAGMADRLDYPDTPWTVDLIDYKTDDDLDDGTIYNMMPPPFEHLGETKLNQYSIQVNIYADLIEKCTPYTVRKIELVSVGEKAWKRYIMNRMSVINLVGVD